MRTITDIPAEATRSLWTAWKAVAKDYDARYINSERCLQAALYYHLRILLPSDGYRIFVEPFVSIPGRPPHFIDTLVVFEGKVVLALELKYKPRGQPTANSISKDISKLAFFKLRREKELKGTITVKRFLGDTRSESLSLAIAPGSVGVFGVFARANVVPKTTKAFWQRYGAEADLPSEQGRKRMPKRLLAFVADAHLSNAPTTRVIARDASTSRFMLTDVEHAA